MLFLTIIYCRFLFVTQLPLRGVKKTRQALLRALQKRRYTTISVPCYACGEWRGRP